MGASPSTCHLFPAVSRVAALDRGARTNYIDDMNKGRRNLIRTRDILMVRVINGVTKGAVHLDWKKEKNRMACREWEGCDDADGEHDRWGTEGGGCDLGVGPSLEDCTSSGSRDS